MRIEKKLLQRSNIFITVALLGFLVFKIARFILLNYSYNDMYIFLNMSCGWMDGRPFMYENIWGFSDRIHNNYSMLLWGPIIHWLGAYGVFMIQTVLFAISYIVLYKYLRLQTKVINILAFFVILLFGPIWFWFNDHPGIGWHPELTYLPFSILFVVFLLQNNTLGIIISSLNIILVKEDGALLAGCIHLAFLGITFTTRQPHQPIWTLITKRRFWIVALAWGLVFMLGMAFMSFKNQSNAPEPRLQKALQIIQEGIENPLFLKQNLILLRNLLLLMSPIWLWMICLVCHDKPKQGLKVMFIYSFGFVAILGSNWVQGSLYFDNPYFEKVSITWPPRFVLLYAYSLCFMLIYWDSLGGKLMVNLSNSAKMTLVALAFLIQIPVVYVARPDFPLFDIAKKTLLGRYDQLDSPLLNPNDIEIARQIASHLPAHSEVFVFDFLIPIFHKHYNIWPTGNHLKAAELAIIPKNDFQNLTKTLQSMPQQYRIYPIKEYNIYVNPRNEDIIKKIVSTQN